MSYAGGLAARDDRAMEMLPAGRYDRSQAPALEMKSVFHQTNPPIPRQSAKSSLRKAIIEPNRTYFLPLLNPIEPNQSQPNPPKAMNSRPCTPLDMTMQTLYAATRYAIEHRLRRDRHRHRSGR